MKTFGWDTAFIVKAERINALLQAHRDTTVLSFDTSLPNLSNWQAKGIFQPWQLTDGGSQEIVHLKLTIDSGTLTDGTTVYDLKGLSLVVATFLQWLEFGASENNLQFGYERLGPVDKPPERGELAVIALRDPNQVLPPDINALLAYALGSYLVEHAAEVRFVFATVNLIPPTTNSWLTPVKSAYGYFIREGSAQAVLAILSVTTNRNISNLQRTIDPAAFPTTTDASFVISDSLFLLNIIAPSLAHALRNANTSDFYYDIGASVLRNRVRLWTRTVRSGLIDYDPWLDTLEIRSGQDALQGHYAGGVDLKAGISMTYQIDATNRASYDPVSGGLKFEPDPSPTESHQADIPWYWYIGGVIVIAVVEIVVKVIGDDIANQISDDNRERLALGKYPPSSILWGGDNVLKVTTVGVNSSLYVMGNI